MHSLPVEILTKIFLSIPILDVLVISHINTHIRHVVKNFVYENHRHVKLARQYTAIFRWMWLQLPNDYVFARKVIIPVIELNKFITLKNTSETICCMLDIMENPLLLTEGALRIARAGCKYHVTIQSEYSGNFKIDIYKRNSLLKFFTTTRRCVNFYVRNLLEDTNKKQKNLQLHWMHLWVFDIPLDSVLSN